MTQHKVGTQEQWQAARDELLAEEKELTRRNDELARKRRELPWVQAEKEYPSRPPTGPSRSRSCSTASRSCSSTTSCSARSYAAGCPVCSSIADNLDPNAIHLAARDVKLMLVSRAPGEAPGIQEADGLEPRLGLDGGQRVQPQLGFLHTEEELKPFLEGELPPAVEQNAEACGVDAATYVSEGPA